MVGNKLSYVTGNGYIYNVIKKRDMKKRDMFKTVDAFNIVNCWNGGQSQEVIRDGKTQDEVKAEFDGMVVFGPYKKEIYVSSQETLTLNK
tara:strand:- start:192 stop:461 length:270 start_codon:yes stop_codon:yes gene_type:complete